MSWTDKLKEYAPHIVGAVLSGGATLPSLAIKAVSDAVGVEIKDEVALEQFVESATPEQVFKIKSADYAFKIRMKELDVELQTSELKDISNAREAHKDSNTPANIMYILTVGLIAFTATLMFHVIPEANQRVIDTIFGSYLTAWISSVAYFVGTTRGSSMKNVALFSNNNKKD
jgi:hypothetical protein